jgi:hypothetical protein
MELDDREERGAIQGEICLSSEGEQRRRMRVMSRHRGVDSALRELPWLPVDEHRTGTMLLLELLNERLDYYSTVDRYAIFIGLRPL